MDTVFCRKDAQKVSASNVFLTKPTCKASFPANFIFDRKVNCVALQQSATGG
jgi:hypothetical protein